MTGEEFAAALRETADKFEIASRVNGLVVEPIPGLRIAVCAAITERTRRHRNGKSVPGAFPEPFPERSPSVPDTPSLSGSDLSSAPDPDSVVPDCLPENLAGSARVAAKARQKRPSKPKLPRWTRFPEDFEPTDEHRAIARSESVSLERELAKIRDWEFRTPRTDPNATLRTWLRRAGEQLRASALPPGRVDHERRQSAERAIDPPALFPPERKSGPIPLAETLQGAAGALAAMRKP